MGRWKSEEGTTSPGTGVLGIEADKGGRRRGRGRGSVNNQEELEEGEIIIRICRIKINFNLKQQSWELYHNPERQGRKLL